jgi:plasmid stabilization system protein ParE
LRVRLTSGAIADLASARAWYQQQRVGLGSELTIAVNQTLSRIQEFPEAFPRVDSRIRHALVRRFPYAIYFHTRGDTIIVIGVFHFARDPDVWRERAE